MAKLVLPPGFRFHPTDEELISHYLKRKVCGQKIDFEAIAEVDLYNYEPWDLPEKSFLQTRDLEWYFFIPRDRKYPNGSRTNRATEKGYWKSTGKDRFVSSRSRSVGTKKTLVYYNGRAPKGERTNWVMHEYRLSDAERQRLNALENGFVLCRIYQKSGAGPKNGEQYGAPIEDEDFENSPPVVGDGSVFSSLFETGSSSAGVHCVPSPTSSSRIEEGYHEVNDVDPQFANAGIQPRKLKFPDSPGNMTSDFSQMENFTNLYAIGSTVLPASGVEDSVAPVCLEEDNLVQELYKLVESSVCAEQLESTERYQDPTSCVDSGFYQPGAHPPSDGDFLELNDLLSVSDCEDGIEAIQSQTKGQLKGFSGELECSSLPQLQVPSFGVSDCSGQWQDLPSGHGMQERQQNMPESMQMQSSVSAVTYDSYDSQYGPFTDSLLDSLMSSSDLYNEELNAACQTDTFEPDVEDVVKLFERAKEDKSFNVESFAENIQRELFHSEDNLLLSAQDGWDGQYYDAQLSFTDVDMYGESISTAMPTASNFGTPQKTLMQASLASKVDGVLDKLAVNSIDSTEHFEGAVVPHDFVSESFLLTQGDGITPGQVKHPPSPLSYLWSCLDSLPTLPASAADLSPKAVSPGRSIRVTATGVGVGAVSVTCTSVGDDVPSSRMDCSVAEVKSTGRFVNSLSFVGQSKPSDKWRIGFYTAAVLGGLCAVFGLLISGGVRKLFGGVYRRMVASET